LTSKTLVISLCTVVTESLMIFLSFSLFYIFLRNQTVGQDHNWGGGRMGFTWKELEPNFGKIC